MVSLTKRKAIKIIESTNREYESFLCNLNRRYHARPESLSPEAAVLAQQYDDVYRCVNSSLWQFYKNTKSGDLKAILDEYLALCRNFNFRTLQSFPKEEFTVSETEDKMPEAIETALEKLEKYGDEQIQKAARQCREGKRIIEFSSMDERQNGQTYRVNDFYTHYITDRFSENTMENQIRLAVTLAHELKRNAATDSLEAETQEIVLSDTKIIESFSGTYGEEIYKKFPEYGILHYIKKIFGETELKEFADYAFNSTGSYWKVNEAGDLADDGNASRVADAKGSELYSGAKGLQGTLQEWLGMENAYAALMHPAGFEWDGRQWSKNPGRIDHSVIEKAHNDGHLTDDQYNLIQLAAGKKVPDDDKSEKISLFEQLLTDYQNVNRTKTQVQVDMANRAWEWIVKKRNTLFKNTKSNFSRALQENENIKEERKWGNNESHCDEYCEAVLKSAGKLPSDWPGIDYKVSWNDNGKRKDSFMEYYRSKLKKIPEQGWNIMLMDGHTRSGNILSPHMVVIYVRDDGLINFSHYTSDNVVEPRIGWTLKEMTDTGKGSHNRFGYSNFKYLPLGK